MDRLEFQEKLKGLSQLARTKGNVLTTEEVQTFLAEVALSEEQLTLVYEYLAASRIVIKGYVQPGEFEELPYTEEEKKFLQIYEADLKAFKKLPQEKVEMLLQQVENGDEKARNAVMEQFYTVVLEEAKALRGRGLPLEDLVQEGNIGLMLSMEVLGLRDPSVSATDYIRGEILGAMRQALEEAGTVRQEGNQIADKVNELSDTIEVLTEDLGRQISVEELSAFLDMDAAEIEKILKLAGDNVEMAESDSQDQEEESDLLEGFLEELDLVGDPDLQE